MYHHLWQRYSVLVLQWFIFISGIFELFSDKWTNGILSLFLLALIISPKFFTRNLVKKIPDDFKLFFLIMILLQIFLGQMMNFYGNIPHYDKFTHFLFCSLVGLMCFLTGHVIQLTGKIHIRNFYIIFISVLIVSGIGAFWEILEYLSDIFLHPYLASYGVGVSQGNSLESPLIDTMNDMITNLCGSVFGSSLGYLCTKSTQKKISSWLSKIIDEIVKNFV